jgi:hypothetical protein
MKFKTMLNVRLVAAALTTALLIAIAWVPTLTAQSSGTGALTGTVTDPSGAVIPDATVTITNNGTQETRKGTTGTDGSYRFALLPPANYKVRFSAKGFTTVEVPSVTINVTETPVLNRRLEIGLASQSISVEANTEAVDTSTSTLGTLVASQTVTALPLTSRNYTQILGLSAGATGVTNAAILGRGTNNISVNGNSCAENNIQMDGVGVNNFARAASSDDNLSSAGVAIPNPDAIQEFVVQTSTYDASYGRNPGANINVVTKSGTNRLHGSAFEFIRNAALNASEYFSRSNLLNQNQFGGALGGPIKKDKIFFFLSYQGTRQKNGISLLGAYTPVLPGLTNDRSAAGIAQAVDPASGVKYCQETPGISCNGAGVDPVALKILQLTNPNGSYFVPSGSGPTPFVDPARYTEDQGIANVDFILSSKHTLSARVLISQNPQFAPFTTTGGSLGDAATMTFSNRNVVVKLTSVLTNKFINEARVSGQRLNSEISDTPPAGSSPADLGMTPIPGITAPPDITLFSGLSMFDDGTPNHSPVNQFQAADQIAWSHGKQTIRAGFEYERVQHNLRYEGIERGWLWFNSLGDFMQGSILSCALCPSGPPNGVQHGYRLNDIATFVQDDWKVRPRVTLNLGLRWEYFGYPSDTHGNLTNENPALMLTVPTPPTGVETSGPGVVGYVVPDNYNTAVYGPLPAGVQESSTGYTWGAPAKTNFAPRFGLAWQPTNSGKLVVRLGAGIYYNRVSEDGMVHGVNQSPPYSLTLNYGPGTGHTLEAPFASSSVLGQFASRWMNFTCLPDGTGCTYLTTNGVPGEVAGQPVAPGTGYSSLNTPYVGQSLHTPLLRQYNLNVEYEFAPSWVLQVGYVGSSGINWFDQYRDRNIPQLASPSNPINGQIASTIENIPLRVAILGYEPGGLQVSTFDGITNYNSLQITLKKQFSHGFQMQAAYTWSKSLTNLQPNATTPGEMVANVNNPDDMRESYGPSSFNAPQALVVHYVYDFPFIPHAGALLGKLANGWSVSGVTVVEDGVPLIIYDSNGGTAYGISTSTAELCPGVTPSQMLSHGSMEYRAANGYFNPAAFCNQPSIGDGTGFGNSPVGAVLGPGQFNWDLSLQKDIKISETKKFVFRTEFYNLPNHTQFGNPEAASSNANLPITLMRLPNGQLAPTDQGLITCTAVNPRLIQFGLKFIF